MLRFETDFAASEAELALFFAARAYLDANCGHGSIIEQLDVAWPDLDVFSEENNPRFDAPDIEFSDERLARLNVHVQRDTATSVRELTLQSLRKRINFRRFRYNIDEDGSTCKNQFVNS